MIMNQMGVNVVKSKSIVLCVLITTFTATLLCSPVNVGFDSELSGNTKPRAVLLSDILEGLFRECHRLNLTNTYLTESELLDVHSAYAKWKKVSESKTVSVFFDYSRTDGTESEPEQFEFVFNSGSVRIEEHILNPKFNSGLYVLFGKVPNQLEKPSELFYFFNIGAPSELPSYYVRVYDDKYIVYFFTKELKLVDKAGKDFQSTMFGYPTTAAQKKYFDRGLVINRRGEKQEDSKGADVEDRIP